jgi:rod shape-determining protein MreC
MISFGKTIKNHKSSSLLILLLCISLILMSVSTGNYKFSPKKIGNTILSIFQIAVSKSTNMVSDTFNSINELKKLKTQHDSLLLKIQKYQIQERDLIELKEENNRLRSQLDIKESSDFIYKSAEIIAHEPGNIFTSFVINKGTTQGIQVNMPVLAFQYGFQGLVGKIVETGLFTSIVLPIIDDTSYVASRLLESRYEGLTNGLGAKQQFLEMNYVSKNAFKLIEEGDLVITSGLQSLYPHGIYIGRIRDIDIPEWQTSLVLKIEPVIDFSMLEYVLILVGEK